MLCYTVITVRDTTKQNNRKGTTKMTKQTFIERLAQKADITQQQSEIVVNTIEDHNLFCKSERAEIIADIADKLVTDEQTAEKYFAEASKIVSSEIKSQTVKWIAGTAVIIIAGIVVYRLRKNKKED